MSLFTLADTLRFRRDRLMVAARRYFPDVELDDGYLLGKLYAAEAYVARELRCFLEPTYVFPFTPTAGQIATLAVDAAGNAIPWAQEPGYDYGPDFFQDETWGYLVLRQKPIISITSIILAYPAPTTGFYPIPNDWIRPDLKYGVIRLVPASSALIAPLGAFVLQALGGGSTVPSMIQVQYTAGLANVRSDPRWADLVDVIFKRAAISVIEDAYLPQSGSTSGDGLSMSLSVDTDKYHDRVQQILHGPPNSNGGLFTSIHGVMWTVGGALA